MTFSTAVSADDTPDKDAAARGAAEADRMPPLVVDLDGTLLQADLLYESVLVLLRTKPWCVFLLPFWLWRGKAVLKRELALRVNVDVDVLPANEALLAWLSIERERGRTLALVSASDEIYVHRVAERFGLFDVVQGSDGTINLEGRRKLEALRRHFGDDFTYAGDTRPDLVIWEHCRSAVLAGDGVNLRGRLSPGVTVTGEYPSTARSPLRVWIKALRLHQWAKNLLLFVPLLLSGLLADVDKLAVTVVGFVAFGLLASGSYLINDLLDLSSDRRHRSKRRRPLASGDLPLLRGMMALPAIAATVAVLLAFLPVAFAQVALLYLVVTLAYSFHLKRKPILDVVILAFLFTVRIMAGIAAVGTEVSPWLLTFSMFFFLSLAAIKRYSECRVMAAENRTSLPGRGYRPDDAPWMMAMGAATGFCSTLVFFLYLVDTQSPVRHYAHPEWMWGICVILCYWLGRVWLLAGRGEMNDDPVLFAVKDRVSLLLAGLTAAIVALAHIGPSL